MRGMMSLTIVLPTDGFFDAGMLMQALKAKENGSGERPSEKVVQRREVGTKLRLMEY
jgi:carnitine O-acetyltransferase